jgi:hypothetical protein
MARSGKTLQPGEAEPLDFSLATKKQLRVRRKELVLADSNTLRYEFQRMQDVINWDGLRQASTEEDVNAALSRIDQTTRDRLPSAAAILATVQDPKYPKLRPIRFLAESCALATRNKPKRGDVYAPRYSRDICYQERKRRGPAPKPVTDLEYWRGQAKLGQRVPTRFLRRINKEEAKEKQTSASYGNAAHLTYTDIPEKIDNVKKRRTTVWLPEKTVAKLKDLSAKTGAPMSELFRRAVETYLNRS